MNTASKKGQLIVISGPSGVGKGTICRAVMSRLPEVCLSISATTRPQAATEVDGRDYHFMTHEAFESGIAQGRFLEYAEVFGNHYGTPKDAVDDLLAQGKTVFLEIDVQGGRQAKALYPTALLVFILPPDMEALEERLHLRGRDTSEHANRRLREAEAEIASAREFYEHLMVNDNLEQAIEEVIRIIQNHVTGLTQA
jgi:guanylate kinase